MALDQISAAEMTPEEKAEGARKAASFLKALANESRLMILCVLAEREMNVSELEHALGIRQPNLSQQLARLRADDLVATRQEGKQVYYSLASHETERIIGLMYEMFCATPGAGQKKASPAGEKTRSALQDVA